MRSIRSDADIAQAIIDGWDFPVSFDGWPEPMPLQQALKSFQGGFECPAAGIKERFSVEPLVLRVVIRGLTAQYSMTEIEAMVNEFFDESDARDATNSIPGTS